MIYTVILEICSSETKAKQKAKALVKKVQCAKVYASTQVEGNFLVSFYETFNRENAEKIEWQARRRGIECFICHNDNPPVYLFSVEKEQPTYI